MVKKFFISLLAFTIIFLTLIYFQDPPLLKIKAVQVDKGDIASVIKVPGLVVNDKVVKLASLVDGQIQSININIGDRVNFNELLVVFSNTEQTLILEKLKIESKLRQQEVIDNSIQQRRMEKLFKSGSMPKEKFEKMNLALLSSKIELELILKEIEIAQNQLFKTKIFAPFSGVIIDKLSNSGQWVEAGTHLLTLASEQSREIEAHIDISDLEIIKRGINANISSDSQPGFTWKEKVLMVSPVTFEGKGNTFSVRLSLSESAPMLLLDQQVDVEILVQHRSGVLKLPHAAIINNDNTSPKVAILKDFHYQNNFKNLYIKFKCAIFNCKEINKKTIKIIPVETGVEDFKHIEIVNGLSKNDYVALIENNIVYSGMDVIIAND